MHLSKLIKAFLFLLPLLEIAGFIFVGGWLGVLPTLLLIVLTTLVGLFIVRTQGFVTLMQIQRRMQAGEHPAKDALGGALLMFGGFLMVLPGFITDIAGLLLLIPFVRIAVLHCLVKHGVVVSGPINKRKRPSVTGRTIEGEWRHEDNKEK